MARKPANLIYAVDEPPPWGMSFILGLQHVFLLSIAFIFPVVVIQAIGGSEAMAENLIAMAMIATGLATILQGLPRGPVGSGYLCPLLNGPAYLSASLLAGQAGGLPLIFGMTAVGGVCEGLFSRLVPRLRAVFPPAVTGTVVFMVGIEVIRVAIPLFFGGTAAAPRVDATATFVGCATFLAMAASNVWGRGRFRLYSALVGLGVGYFVALLTGVLPLTRVTEFIATPLLRVPQFAAYGMTFSWALLVPFLVATLSSALKTMGDLTTCQKMNDADWKRADMQVLGRGVLAGGAGNVISGLLGALGQSVSSSNIGLAIATGAASRRIAWTIGTILIGAAFLPKLAFIFVIMPRPVMGAALVFSVSFMIVAGLQIITARMLDARKTFVVGVAVIFGLSVDFCPALYAQLPHWCQPLCASSLSLATLAAVVLNLFFRLGISRTLVLDLRTGEDAADTIFRAVEQQGAAWGARREVMYAAKAALTEFMEAAAELPLTDPVVRVTLTFDEFNLDARLRYAGPLLPDGAVRPTRDELRTDPQAPLRLAAFLLRQYADRVTGTAVPGGSEVTLHFVH